MIILEEVEILISLLFVYITFYILIMIKVSKKTNNNLTKLSNVNSNNIIVGIASVKKREATLELTIRSIINQVDKIYLYLDDYDKNDIPYFIKNPTYLNNNQLSKIKINRPSNKRYYSTGKFLIPKEEQGYIFIIDDDIIYPPDYVSTMISYIKKYNHTTAVCVHATQILYTYKHFYDAKSKKSIQFEHPLNKETKIDIPGTGTFAYHTSFFNIDYKEHIIPKMDDIWVGSQLKEKNIDVIAIPRKYRWLFNADITYKNSVFYTGRTDTVKNNKTNELIKKYFL